MNLDVRTALATRIARQKRIIEHYGEEAQMFMVAEEAGELLSAINKYRRGRGSREQIAVEIADLLNVLEQLKYSFGCEDIERIQSEKLDREINRIERQELDLAGLKHRVCPGCGGVDLPVGRDRCFDCDPLRGGN